MVDFLTSNASAFFTLLSSLLTMALGFFFTQRTQTKKDIKELKIKEIELKHKISEATYQKLFEKRIETYNNLHKIVDYHNKNILNIGRYKEDEVGVPYIVTIEEQDIYIEFIKAVTNELESNMFYISNKLENKFLDISLPFTSDNIKKSDIFMFANYGDDELEEEARKINIEFYQKHKKEIIELINLLDEEIKIIKEKIDFN